MAQQFGFIGVPSSAGAKTPGIEKAPEAIRAAGLINQLQGCVVDYGDLSRERYASDPGHPRALNLPRVITVARRVAKQVEEVLQSDQIPLVIGGDCSITVGVVAACTQNQPDLRLIYIDGGLDLYTPETNLEGNLDSMGVAHMLAEPGTDTTLSHLGARFPLLTPQQVIYFGYEALPPDDPEQIALVKYGMRHFPASVVRGRAQAAAQELLAEMGPYPFLVHFDVDVIDFNDFAIADVPLFGQGLKFTEAMSGLAVFASNPHFAGLVITEINPDHMDEQHTEAHIFVRELVRALT
ncbi:MAG: arginase family protein [Anaerolineae bacterium]